MSLEKIRWARKIRQAWIRQLYQDDADGTPDPDLLHKTGQALLARAQSIVMATRGEVECPRCAQIFALERNNSDPQPCPAGCGWACSRADFGASWRHQELLAANALSAFETFTSRYPTAQSDPERMFQIDRLLHAFHWDAKFNLPNRSTANNLIEGSHSEVVQMLDELSAANPSPENQAWKATVTQMNLRRRGQTFNNLD